MLIKITFLYLELTFYLHIEVLMNIYIDNLKNIYLAQKNTREYKNVGLKNIEEYIFLPTNKRLTIK